METNKIYCKDCIEGMKEIPDKSIDLIITDPPYDVDYGKKSEHLTTLGKARDKQIERDKEFIDEFKAYTECAQEWYRILKDDSHCYIFCGANQIKIWSEEMVKAGFKQPQILTWIKGNTTFDMTFGYKFPSNSEFILFFHKGWKKLNGYGVERDNFRTAIYYDSDGDTDTHSCAKPIGLIMYLTKLSSKEGDICLDCFMGGGSHIIAFKRLKRQYIGYEIAQKYYEAVEKKIIFEDQQLTFDKVEDWFK